MSKTKTLNRRRYRPVSEFDEATLASKREYWRTRKREQRARLSLVDKKLSKRPHTGICKPMYTMSTQTSGHAPDIPRSKLSSTFLNSAGSSQTNVGQNLTNSSCFTTEIKSEQEISQKETSVEETKCNKIAHQFPQSSTDSKKCRVVHKEDVKGLSSEESSMAASMVKLNGVQFTSFPVPTPCVQVPTNNTEFQHAQNKFSPFKGSLLTNSQHRNVSRFRPECNQQKNPQIKSCLPPRPSAFVSKSKADKGQHNTGGRGINPRRKPCAYVPECSTAMPMTEEEKAAKRRENWRIKKREQRAKRAEKLKKDKERTQCFEKGQEDVGKLSCVVPTHSLSSVSTMALREAKQLNSVTSANLTLHKEKAVNVTAKVAGGVLSTPLNQSNFKHLSARVDGVRGSIARNILSVNRTNHMQNLRPNPLCGYSGISQRSATVTPTTNQSKIHHPKLVHVQWRPNLPQRNERMETAEERHAKQREYWRIRKRLQRARLSLEVKARLKERDALKRCAVNSQKNLEQVRKIQTGFQRASRPNKTILLNAPETSGFVQGNTLSFPILKASPKTIPQATSCRLRTVQPLNPTGTLTSRKMVCIRTSSTKSGIPNSLNSSMRIQRRPTDQTVVPLLGSKLVNSTADTDVLPDLIVCGNGEESNQEYRATSGRVLRSSNSSSGVSSNVDLPHNTIKRESSYPLIESVYSLSGQSQSTDVKPSPSESRAENLICDSQATTLLAVASMKKLLEETLSTVVDNNIDQDGLLPCKMENKLSSLEMETNFIPDLTTPHEAEECNFSGNTYPSIEIKQSPTLCPSPLQAPGFSAEDAALSCQSSLLQFPLTSTVESSCLSQGPADRTQDLSVAVGVKLVYRRRRDRRAGPQQLNENSELQKKREYWRVMKRRQRARKAKEMERCKYTVQHRQLSQPIQRKYLSSQVRHSSVARAASHTNISNHAVQSDVTQLILSPSTSNPRSNLHSPNGAKSTFPETSQMKKWQLQPSAFISSSRPDTVTSTQKSQVKSSGSQMEIRRPLLTGIKNNQGHLKAAANQGQDPEEILKRKRMHWRIKKQEQRARKAARERELRNQTELEHLGLNSSSNITALVQSSTSPQRLSCLPKQSQITSFKDEAELCFLPDDDCSDEPLSEAKWRSTYLMDYDPINQLLVCMVCGEQQYCLSVEGVKAHIEEVHPGSLSLGEKERQDILRAWDEQVAVRERFFTKQLWQNSDCLKEESIPHTAEIEVILDADDLKQTNK